MQERAGYLSGSVSLSTTAKGKPRKTPVWELRYRLPTGKQSDKVLGKAWIDQGAWSNNGEIRELRSRPADGFLTRGQAETEAQKFLDAQADVVPQDRITFGRAASDFILYCTREKSLGGGTVAEYKRIADRLSELPWRNGQAWETRPLNTFTAEDLLALRRQMLDEGLDPHTINMRRGVLRGIFGDESKTMAAWKWVGLKRKDSRGKIRCYTPQQVARLKEHAADDRDRLIYTLATEEGLRISEQRGLKIPNLDFTNGIIHIEDAYTDDGGHGPTKSHSKRSVPMTLNARTLLIEYIAGRTPYTEDDQPRLVFEEINKPALDYDQLYGRYQKAVAAAGLPWIKLHDLRHTFGTQMIQHPKVDIYKLKTLMGHASITTTEIYLHYEADPELADVMSSIWESDNGGGTVIPMRRAS